MYERSGWMPSSSAASWAGELTESNGEPWIVATVLPEQFHNPVSSVYQGRPEAALMQAVLEDAVDCIRYGLRAAERRKQRLAREAEEWLLSDEAEWPFSFLNICTILGLEPQYIRRGVQRWHQQCPPWAHKSKRRVVRSRNPVRMAA